MTVTATRFAGRIRDILIVSDVNPLNADTTSIIGLATGKTLEEISSAKESSHSIELLLTALILPKMCVELMSTVSD